MSLSRTGQRRAQSAVPARRAHRRVDPAGRAVLPAEDASPANASGSATQTLTECRCTFVPFAEAWEAVLGALLGPSRPRAQYRDTDVCAESCPQGAGAVGSSAHALTRGSTILLSARNGTFGTESVQPGSQEQVTEPAQADQLPTGMAYNVSFSLYLRLHGM